MCKSTFKIPPNLLLFFLKDGIHKEQQIRTHAAYSIKQIQVHAQVIAFLMNDLPAQTPRTRVSPPQWLSCINIHMYSPFFKATAESHLSCRALQHPFLTPLILMAFAALPLAAVFPSLHPSAPTLCHPIRSGQMAARKTLKNRHTHPFGVPLPCHL